MDWQYIAGFFDREGNIHINTIRKDRKLKGLQIVCRIYSQDREHLEKISDFLECGKIYEKKHKIFELTISKKKEVLSFLNSVVKRLYLKRGQAEFVLKNYNFGRENNKTFDVDKFRSFSKRRNKEYFIKNDNERMV